MTSTLPTRADVHKALTQTVGYPFLSSKEIVDAVFPLLDAAAARVPELEAEIERLTVELSNMIRVGAESAIVSKYEEQARRLEAEIEWLTAENEVLRQGGFHRIQELAAERDGLRARLNAAPDLTELRATREAMRKRNGFVDTAAFMVAVDRLLAAVPPDA